MHNHLQRIDHRLMTAPSGQCSRVRQHTCALGGDAQLNDHGTFNYEPIMPLFLHLFPSRFRRSSIVSQSRGVLEVPTLSPTRAPATPLTRHATAFII